MISEYAQALLEKANLAAGDAWKAMLAAEKAALVARRAARAAAQASDAALEALGDVLWQEGNA